MRHAGNFNAEWGYLAPAPSFLRTARLVIVAAAIGATAGAAVVFSLVDRPEAEESVAARTLVRPLDSLSAAANSPIAAQLQTQSPHEHASAEARHVDALGTVRGRGQGALVAANAGAVLLAGESGATSTVQHPPIAAALAEAPVMKEEAPVIKEAPPAHVADDTAAAPPPAQKAPAKRSRLTARAVPRYAMHHAAPRYRPRYDQMERGPYAQLRPFGAFGEQEY
jgi:hypothetical protein